MVLFECGCEHPEDMPSSGSVPLGYDGRTRRMQNLLVVYFGRERCPGSLCLLLVTPGMVEVATLGTGVEDQTVY